MSPLETLLDNLDESRERLLIAIEPLDDFSLLEASVVGDWTIADVLTNLTAWEAELVTGLLKLDQNKRAGKLMAAIDNPQVYNQQHFNDMKARDLDQIFEDLQQVRIQLEDWLSEFSDKDLTRPNRYPGLGGRPLQEIIAAATYERENKFLPAIEAFARQRQYEEEAAAESMIPLNLHQPGSEKEAHDRSD